MEFSYAKEETTWREQGVFSGPLIRFVEIAADPRQHSRYRKLSGLGSLVCVAIMNYFQIILKIFRLRF
jgi:hypothetical protein